jgi:hypothetical protein
VFPREKDEKAKKKYHLEPKQMFIKGFAEEQLNFRL